jgi:type IV pilus assembly protein PilP
MRSAYAIVLLAISAAIGCGGDKASAPAPAPPKAAPAPVVKAEEKVEPPVQEWAYSSVGKRDPFRSFLAEIESTPGAIATRCTTPLGRFELEQLKLVAVITGLDDPVAMVEAPGGTGYSLKRGACLGRNGGVVSAVRSGEVIVSEWAIRADGTRERAQTILRLPKEPSLNLEE